MSDPKLAQSLKQNRAWNGHFELPVNGWKKLSKAVRDRLAARLQYAAVAYNQPFISFYVQLAPPPPLS